MIDVQAPLPRQRLGPALPRSRRPAADGTVRRRDATSAATSALERKAEVELQMYRGSYVAREERETPFRLLYQRWWDNRQISATRRYTDAQRGAKHVLPYWGDWPICTIRPSDIDDWVARLSKTMSPQSV